MSSPLEKFILENRSAFDDDAPDPRVWEKIADRVDLKESKKVVPVRSLSLKRWLSVAAVIVFLGSTLIIYYSRRQTNTQAGIAEIKPAKIEPSNHAVVPAQVDTPSAITKTENNPESEGKTNPLEKHPDPAVTEESKEMYYYAKLIELKHEELKALEKDEPLLYRQFSADVQKLDSVYHTLKTQLPNNSNREQVIEAMISNLQLQIGLLNKQLDIIKQIKHSKKSAYEKAYKSV